MKSTADDNWGRAEVADNGSHHDVYTLAGALVFARLYPRDKAERYRAKVADALMAAINTEGGAANTSLGRNLSSYIIAADLINFRAYAPDREARWRTWLESILKMKVDGMTLAERHGSVLTNHGTVSGGSRIAAAIYLGNKKELRRAARVFRGWLGVSSAYNGFSYNGPRDWFCNPNRLVGINPRGCSKRIDGADRNIDGVLATELSRSGAATWPPRKTNYVWGSLQGVTMQAELLRRRGFKVLRWANSALLRAFDRQWRWEQDFGGWWGDGASADSAHVPALAVFWYGDRRPWPQIRNAGKGKNYGWTEWTHGTRASSKRVRIRLPAQVTIHKGLRGKVKSLRGFCERRRTIKLKKKRPGRDPIIGRDRTSKNGTWEVRRTRGRGRVYALVVAKKVAAGGRRYVCVASRSRTVRR